MLDVKAKARRRIENEQVCSRDPAFTWPNAKVFEQHLLRTEFR
jgi:hypothetical protein